MNQLTHLLTYALILSSLSCNKKQETDEIPNADSVKIIKPHQ